MDPNYLPISFLLDDNGLEANSNFMLARRGEIKIQAQKLASNEDYHQQLKVGCVVEIDPNHIKIETLASEYDFIFKPGEIQASQSPQANSFGTIAKGDIVLFECKSSVTNLNPKLKYYDSQKEIYIQAIQKHYVAARVSWPKLRNSIQNLDSAYSSRNVSESLIRTGPSMILKAEIFFQFPITAIEAIEYLLKHCVF